MLRFFEMGVTAFTQVGKSSRWLFMIYVLISVGVWFALLLLKLLMLSAGALQSDNLIINLYDKYSAPVYNLLLQLMDTKAQAGAVLVEVFEKVHRNNLSAGQGQCMAVSLLSLTVITAYRRQFNATDFLEKFNLLPRVHRLLIGNINLETFTAELPHQSEIYGREIALGLDLFSKDRITEQLIVQN